jgi:hypothetical protein
MTSITICLLLLAGPGAFAASNREPPPVLTDAVQAVAAADAAGASDYAPMELGFAHDRLEQAKAAFAKKDTKLTIRLAEEAAADARLAEIRSRAAKARAAVAALGAENDRLKHDVLGEGAK